MHPPLKQRSETSFAITTFPSFGFAPKMDVALYLIVLIVIAEREFHVIQFDL